MKQTNLLKTFLLLCALVVGSTCAWADSYTITFKEGSGTTSDSGTKVSSIEDIISDGASYIESITDVSNVYNARVGRGIKLGTGSKIGSLTLNLKEAVKPTKITFNARKYNDSETSITVNGTAITDLTGDFDEYTVNYDGATDVTSIAISTPEKRAYITQVTVHYEGTTEKTDPTITFNNGSVKVGKTLDLSTLFTSNSTGTVTYSITAGNTYATISGSTLTGVAEGSVTVQASQAATNAYNAKTADATITVQAAPVLSSIAITTAPTKTTYNEGETFDATGMVVTATYSDAATEDVTALCTWTPNGALTTSDSEITISYTENEITKTATQAITVNKVPAVAVTWNFETNIFSFPENSGSKTTDSNNYTDGTYTINLAGGGNGNGYYYHTSGKYLLMGKQGCALTFPAFPFNVSKIKIHGTSGASTSVTQNIFVGDEEVSNETTGAKNVINVYDIDAAYQAAGNIYVLKVTGNANTQISKIEIFGYVSPSVTSAGWATYVTPCNLEFAEGDAFVVSAATASTATLAPVTKIGANKAVLLKGEGVKTATVLNEAPADVANELAISTGGEIDGYVLAKKNDKVGFYKWAGGSLTSGKVYLPAPAGARDYLEFSFDETTALTLVNSEKRTVNSDIYNLAGQRVAQPTKGLYIVNGKKVVIK